MKRSVAREKHLPSISCDAGSLGILVSDLLRHFGDKKLAMGIYFKFNNEELTFDSIEDFLSHEKMLPNSICNIRVHIFEINMYSGNKIHIYSRGNRLVVSAESDNLGWCAAATEIVKDFAMRHKKWYSFVQPWMISSLVWAHSFVPIIYYLREKSHLISHPFWFISWMLIFVILIITYIRFGYVFPSFRLSIRMENRWVRKYATEITVVAALVSAIAAIVALFVSQ